MPKITEYSNAAVFEHHLGSRKIYGTIVGDVCTIRADCRVADSRFGESLIRFTVPAVPALVYFEGRRTVPIQELFPDLPAPLRELFITGTSPAEYDAMLGQCPKAKAAFIRKYTPLGYVFES
jgi:hypothetical protein